MADIHWRAHLETFNDVDVRLFDLFTGEGVPQGMKSLAVEVMLQPGDKSFTDAELKAISERIVAAGEGLGASLRG